MRKKIAFLLIAISLTLNVAFVGFWVVRAFRSSWMDDESEGKCPLHNRLGTTPEQWKRIEPLVTAFRDESQAVCREVTQARLELLDLLAASEPDMQKIAAKQEEIRACQRRMQELVIKHILAEKELLTPEQQAKLFELLRKRSDCAGRGPMMGMGEKNTGDQGE